ncbi:MAG: hypothetical protein NC926_10855 [Candidatus Omnitrophica bacterium]|nr:hypothetical protein [Candidatus Omnitrophota bacterium]MCM8808411.1 hypothetical protein [Candidatus Omnitrophota bacterium]
MENSKSNFSFKKIKGRAIPFFLFPILITILGKFLDLHKYVPITQNYETEILKNFMKFLYFLGLGIFFFCNGFSDYISKKIFSKKSDYYEKIRGYYFYTLIMLSFINLISVSGFLGFLICGNFSWLATFSIINFLTLFSYFPSQKKFKHKFEKFQ